MPTQKNIDVRDQVTLSFEKSFLFCRKGISYRLFRSSLTLAVVVVAVAFFTFLLSESLMVHSTAVGVSDEMASAREADSLLMHLFYRYSSGDLSAKLAGIKGKDQNISEFARVCHTSDDAIENLVTQCHLEQRYLKFFADLAAGKRVVLVKKHTGRDVLTFLADPVEWDAFLIALKKMRSVRLPEDPEVLRSFLDQRAAFMASLNTIRAGRVQSIAGMESKLAAVSGGKEVSMWLGSATDGEIEQWRKIVNETGFDLDKETMARVRGILRVSAIEDRIARLLQTPEKREAWKVSLQSTPGLEDKLLMLKQDKVAALLGSGFSVADRAAVSDRFSRMKYLRTLVGKLPAVDTSSIATTRILDGRQMFLVLISFLVCMVGITNAMLMSITERFREIATMKCLGATDGFILKQFLIEAAIQGVVGGTVGMIIGMIISVLKSSIILGGSVFVHFPALQMLMCAVATVAIGILLAMLASIYPAKAAASMAPMDAMRVE